MLAVFRRTGYSARAWMLASFMVAALALGGGGTPNPTTEIALELIFVAFALVWLWLPRGVGETPPRDPWVLALVAVPLAVPIVQLIPLPPAIWTALPGRQSEIDALSLVGQQSSWRPVSLSPNRTLAALLAIVPAVFCLHAVSRLALFERRLVLAAILSMATLTSLLGAIQLTAGGRGLNLYAEHHTGWVTGFQANRNAAADVLLVGLLTLAALAAPYLVGARMHRPLRLDKRALALLTGVLALFLLAATVMTGSRTGTALVLVAGAVGVLIFAVGRETSSGPRQSWPLAVVLLLVLAGLGVAFLALADTSAASRVALRYADMDSSRGDIWVDAWYALKQYWPVGFGIGGFEPAMLPAERLEVLMGPIPNRAHNDFLELGLEAGLLGYAMLVAEIILCLAVAWRSWRDVPGSRRQVIFGLGVLIIVGLHSVVDYPLRSMAVACLAGVAAGTLVRTRASTNHPVSIEAPLKVKGLA